MIRKHTLLYKPAAVLSFKLLLTSSISDDTTNKKPDKPNKNKYLCAPDL